MNDIATQAYNKAKTYVQANPLSKETDNETKERTAFHAVLNIIDDRISRAEKDAIIALWVHATGAERSEGWSNGWDAAKTAYRVEVAA